MINALQLDTISVEASDAHFLHFFAVLSKPTLIGFALETSKVSLAR